MLSWLKRKDDASATSRAETPDETVQRGIARLAALRREAAAQLPDANAARAALLSGLAAIEAALTATRDIEAALGRAKSALMQAARASDEERPAQADAYAEAIRSIDQIVRNAAGRGMNLLSGRSEDHAILISLPDRSTIVVDAINATAGPDGLALPEPFGEWSSVEGLLAPDKALRQASATLAKTKRDLIAKAQELSQAFETLAQPSQESS